MRRSLMSLGLLVLAACGGPEGKSDYTVTNIQENSKPTGFIVGRILDAADGKPVVGATITVQDATAVTVISDANGGYRMGPIPAGSFRVLYQAGGYLKRSFNVTIGGTNGAREFPVGNAVVTQDVDMARPDATIEGQVLTNTGAIAKGAQLFIDLRESGFELVVTAKTDENGKFKISGLPGAAFGQFVTMFIAPYDENDDGSPDYNSQQRSFSLFPGATTYSTITLFALGLQLVTSNVSDNDLLPTEAITLTFSGAARTNQSTITLTRNVGNVQVGTTVKWDETKTTATLTPVGGPLVEGQAYLVNYNVRATNGAATNSQLTFVVRPPGGLPPLGTVKGFRMTSPVAADSTSVTVTLAWDALANAGGYRVYGRDSTTASAYLLVSSVQSGLTTQASMNIALFDSISGDPFLTPMGHKNKVSLSIVAVDRVGNETSFATTSTLELADTVPPTVSNLTQLSGSAFNVNGASAATVVLQVTFSEPMATEVLPQVVLPHPATSAVFAWSTANRGNVIITVPAGLDGRGTVTISGAKDTNDLSQLISFDSPLQ